MFNLVDSGASSNVMPYLVCIKLNISLHKYVVQIVQLDQTKVKFLGQMNSVLIGLSSSWKVFQIIDILIMDIPEFYGLILSRDSYEKLHGYFAIDWSHMWLPYNGKPNQIRVDWEKHMKYSVTDFDFDDEKEYPFLVDYVLSQIGNFSQTDSSKCINIVENLVNKHDCLFWTLYFDGSKYNDGAGVGCILVNPKGEKTILACRLEFYCHYKKKRHW